MLAMMKTTKPFQKLIHPRSPVGGRAIGGEYSDLCGLLFDLLTDEGSAVRLSIARGMKRGLSGNPLPTKNNDRVVAAFSAQDKPIPGVLSLWSLQDADLTRPLGIQNIDGPVPAVLRSRRLGSADRPGVRGEDAQAFLGQFRWKDLHADGRAGQTSGNVPLRRAIGENLKGAALGEFTGPNNCSGRGTLISRVQWCRRGQPRGECRHRRRSVRLDHGRRRKQRLREARNTGGWQYKPPPLGCGSSRCLASNFALDAHVPRRTVRRVLHRLPMLDFLLSFPPHRRGIGPVVFRGPIGGAGVDWSGFGHGRPEEPPYFGERALTRAAHHQTHQHIAASPQVGNAAGAEEIRRQFVVQPERSILDFERSPLALLDDTGIVVPIDSQLAPRIQLAQGLSLI